MTSGSFSKGSEGSPHPASAYVLAVMAPLGFVIADSIAKHLAASLPVMEVVWGRYFFHMLALLPVALVLGWRRVARTGHPRHQALRACTMLAATSFTYLAVRELPLPDVYIIAFTAPILVTIAGALWLKERVRTPTWLAVIACFAGALIVVRPGFSDFNIGYLHAFGMALSFALYQVLTRVSHNQDPPLVSLFYAASLGAAVSSAAVPFWWQAPLAHEWALLAALGLMGALAQLCLIRALTVLPASTYAPFAYTQLIWSAAVSALFFNLIPGPATLAGGILVVGANLLVLLEGRRHRSRLKKGNQP